jgi:hypothetical protein
VTSPEDAFGKLLGRQPTDKERDRLYRVRDALGIRENDAFWYIVMMLEFYDSLYLGYPARMAEAAEAAIERARGAFEAAAVAESARMRRLLAEELGRGAAAKPGVKLEEIMAAVGAVLGSVVLFGGVCMSAGVALGSRAGARGSWDVGGGNVWLQLVAKVLNIPAGWMAFALLLPGLVHGGRLGWRLTRLGSSRAERVGGWGLLGVSVVGGMACVVVLSQLGAVG